MNKSYLNYGVRHEGGTTTDTALPTHRILVGFDHNNNNNNNNSSTTLSLWPTLEPYIKQGLVSYIDWPYQVCNNNIPAADSTGKRSSQYAAENSCRYMHPLDCLL
mmetsp:Transcript_4101/g.5385  ORF Transcript_4101/g.5385 Transcript_4101/m.5385 type:complete len:105 (-) Transcript_4101:681-995(-)